MSITCPQCGRVSHHPQDIRHRYCGHCHMYHADMNNKTMKIEIEPKNRIRQLYYHFMTAVALFKYLREQKDRKINISITLE